MLVPFSRPMEPPALDTVTVLPSTCPAACTILPATVDVIVVALLVPAPPMFAARLMANGCWGSSVLSMPPACRLTWVALTTPLVATGPDGADMLTEPLPAVTLIGPMTDRLVPSACRLTLLIAASVPEEVSMLPPAVKLMVLADRLPTTAMPATAALTLKVAPALDGPWTVSVPDDPAKASCTNTLPFVVAESVSALICRGDCAAPRSPVPEDMVSKLPPNIVPPVWLIVPVPRATRTTSVAPETLAPSVMLAAVAAADPAIRARLLTKVCVPTAPTCAVVVSEPLVCSQNVLPDSDCPRNVGLPVGLVLDMNTEPVPGSVLDTSETAVRLVDVTLRSFVGEVPMFPPPDERFTLKPNTLPDVCVMLPSPSAESVVVVGAELVPPGWPTLAPSWMLALLPPLVAMVRVFAVTGPLIKMPPLAVRLSPSVLVMRPVPPTCRAGSV